MKVDMHKIESLMILQGMSVKDLMQESGLARGSYYYIKQRGGTSVQTLKAIANTLNVDPRDLLTEQEQKQRLGRKHRNEESI